MKKKIISLGVCFMLLLAMNPAQVEASLDKTNGYARERICGDTRYETGIACAEFIRERFGMDYFSQVVIASATNFPDALSGVSLAGQSYKTPILLVGSTNDTNQVVYNYMKEYVVRSATVYVLGGTAAVPASVVTALKNAGFSNITRLSGNTRYDTNLAIINAMNTSNTDTIVLATGQHYADTLSISGYAYWNEWPIFLVGDSLSTAQLAKIKEIAPEKVLIVGGTNAVSSAVEDKVKSSLTGVTVKRYAGNDRYETSMLIADDWCLTSEDYLAKYGIDGIYDDFAILAYGDNFPDALAGSAIAGVLNAPIILVNSDSSRQAAFLKNKTQVWVLYTIGGTAVIPDSVVNQFVR